MNVPAMTNQLHDMSWNHICGFVYPVEEGVNGHATRYIKRWACVRAAAAYLPDTAAPAARLERCHPTRRLPHTLEGAWSPIQVGHALRTLNHLRTGAPDTPPADTG